MAAIRQAKTAPVVPIDDVHPFTGYLRTVVRGSHIGRVLDEDEAETAFDLILSGEVEPLQLGGFLIVLRYRTEAPSELAGFVRATRRRFQGNEPSVVDLD